MPTPKKLYEIEITTLIYAAADDGDKAIDVALRAIGKGEAELNTRDASSFHVSDSRTINKDWRTAIPFGADGDQTCIQVAAAWEEYERTRPRTAKELEALGQQPLIRGRSEGGTQ
jgi:hypothetical protein